jgi:hypothetical protein
MVMSDAKQTVDPFTQEAKYEIFLSDSKYGSPVTEEEPYSTFHFMHYYEINK